LNNSEANDSDTDSLKTDEYDENEQDKDQDEKETIEKIRQDIHEACNFADIAASGDVNLLDLIMRLDQGIKNRLRVIDTPEANRYRYWAGKLEFLKWITLIIYMLFPFFERPAWCVNNPEIVNVEYC